MKIKLIVWDLDDTLWRGTLADGDDVALFEARAEMVRAFNARGVVSSICSKNDRATAQAKLEALGLWDQFVFACMEYLPKAGGVQRIIESMQLKAAEAIFVDDDPYNLNSVRALLPEIHVLDASAEDTDAILEALLAVQPEDGRRRFEAFRTMETEARDRAAIREADRVARKAFLRGSDIRAVAPVNLDNLDFVAAAAAVINGADALNYTGSHVTVESLTAEICEMANHDSFSIFAWDRNGDYGLVGFAMVHRKEKRLVHFAFSSLVKDMGIENYALTKVLWKEPTCDLDLLRGRLDLAQVDWVRNENFNDPEIRDRLIAQYRPDAVGAHDVRYMWDCQSGGLAHFSRLRSRIEFDHAPRHFGLVHMVTKPDELPAFHPISVYGAGVEYGDPRWPDLIDLLEEGGLFEGCVHLFCEKAVNDGARMLVVLPPEDAPERCYRPYMNHTRARTIKFNAIWRTAAAFYPGIEIFELTGYACGEDMADVSHHYAGFLQKLAGVLDDWVEGKALPVVAVAA